MPPPKILTYQKCRLCSAFISLISCTSFITAFLYLLDPDPKGLLYNVDPFGSGLETLPPSPQGCQKCTSFRIGLNSFLDREIYTSGNCYYRIMPCILRAKTIKNRMGTGQCAWVNNCHPPHRVKQMERGKKLLSYFLRVFTILALRSAHPCSISQQPYHHKPTAYIPWL